MKERKSSMISQKDILSINKELLLHLRDHVAKDQVVRDHCTKKLGSPEKRRKESKLKLGILRKVSQLNSSSGYTRFEHVILVLAWASIFISSCSVKFYKYNVD